MFTIELALRSNPLPLVVHRKEPEGAETLYCNIVASMKGEGASILELTCEKQDDKKIAVLATEILAIQISNKTATANNMGAGFVRG